MTGGARPLRILSIHLGRAPGGSPESLYRLVSRLDRSRFEVTLALPGTGPVFDRFRDLGIAIHTGPIAPFYYWSQVPKVRWTTRVKHSLFAPFEAAFVRRLIDRVQPDLVHLNSALLPVSARAAHAANVPVVVHVREFIPDDDPAARDYVLDAVGRHATEIVSISEASAAAFRGSTPVSVIPEAVDVDEWWRPASRERIRGELGAAPGDTVLLYPAMLLPKKGQRVLIEALRELRERHPRLKAWFAGSTVDRAHDERLRSLARSLTDSGMVSWLGFRRDGPDLAAACDIVVFTPEREEGFGLPIIEAMAAGRPVITSDCGPAREILEPDQQGILIPPGRPEALARSLESLLASPERWRAMGESGRERARAVFSIGDMVARFESVFERVARPVTAGPGENPPGSKS
jgi:glycosyltransferase involved in cell wall biosynthesis